MKPGNTIHLILACFALLGLGACTDSESLYPGADPVAVTFVPEIEGSATRMEPGSGTLLQSRAVDQSWTAGDRVGVSMVAHETVLPAGSAFSQYQVSDAGASVGLTPVAAGQTLFYPTDGSRVNFVAFSPYATVTNNTVSYTAFADQSSGEKVEAVDFLYHKGSTAYTKTSTSAALAFGHKLSKLIIKATTTSDANAVTLASLNMQVTGTPGSVTANLANGSLTAGGTNTMITPYHTSPDVDTRVATAIVVPHAGNTGRTITFAAGEGNFTYTIPASHAFESGKAYTLEFVVSHRGVTLTGAAIDDWTGGTSDWGQGYVLSLAQTELTFEPIEDQDAALSFKTNYGGTLAISLSADADDPDNGTPEWITSTLLTPTPGSTYTSYNYTFTVDNNPDNAVRTAYAHVVDAAGQSLAVVALRQEALNTVSSANAYIVKPNGTAIYIPVSRANAHAPGAIGTDDTFIAEVLWTDTYGLLAGCRTIGTGAGAYIKVTTNAHGVEGNAVVAVKVNNTIKWSWHIWVTDYTPSGQWMDRNLGATSNSRYGRLKAYGLMYQWGRKDPFPGSAADATAVEPALYGSAMVLNGNQQAYNWSVAHPLTFVAYDGSWFNNPAPTAADNQWGHTGGKSLYDPCPEGYRVPVNGSWGVSDDWGTFTWDDAYMGYDAGAYGSWYPASGRRLAKNGGLDGMGKNGYCWSASPHNDINKAFFLYLSDEALDAAAKGSRAYGMPVRCTKEL